MPKHSSGQGEIVLENRQLLVIFLVIAGLCGIFFSLGYIVGRNTFSPSATVARAAPDGPEGGTKPSPMPPAAYLSQAPPGGTAAAGQAAPGTELNFDQSLEEKAPEAKLVSPESSSASPDPSSGPPPSPEPPKAPAVAPPPPPGILVQVSALSRQEDAQTLVQLLKERKLPVLVTSSPSDSLFHVVVGPYPNEKEAQQVKKQLEEDGFQPILKH
ncbi:MAG: hypothetical protein A3J28_08700 [Acidobacteria bacterium RIFCSPLOWO2_12_FULL_60_22]|nr:MAG: hypothetical protein A3J28_08700 [Acidobacteria bacterium RIFCSPLOWO2_12_FULL_60_22]